MRKIIVIAMLGFLAWKGYSAYQQPRLDTRVPVARPGPAHLIDDDTAAQPGAASFACDGRQHCSQMSSCAEATYFVQYCPGTKMDGDHDGIPCEQQLCP